MRKRWRSSPRTIFRRADEDVFVYYFGDSPKEGAMKTGTTTLEIDGERYSYKFRTASSKKGAGVNGIDDWRDLYPGP